MHPFNSIGDIKCKEEHIPAELLQFNAVLFFFQKFAHQQYHFQNLSFNIVVLLRPGLFAWLPEASSPTDQFHVLWA